MKYALIVGLVCLNVALLAALLLGSLTPTANAQVVGGGTDYLMMTGRVATDTDALYVLDLASQKLAVLKWDRTKKRLQQIAVKELPADFKGAKPE